MLKIEEVYKYFGGVKAVDGVSFDISSEKITGLIGPNGAGKSTIFNLITGFSRVDEGSIKFENKEISQFSTQKMVDMGLIRTFQLPGELKNMSVLDNLLVSPRHHPGESLLFGWINSRKSNHFEMKNIVDAKKNLSECEKHNCLKFQEKSYFCSP